MYQLGVTENVRLKNAGHSKVQGWKMQDWKMERSFERISASNLGLPFSSFAFFNVFD